MPHAPVPAVAHVHVVLVAALVHELHVSADIHVATLLVLLNVTLVSSSAAEVGGWLLLLILPSCSPPTDPSVPAASF